MHSSARGDVQNNYFFFLIRIAVIVKYKSDPFVFPLLLRTYVLILALQTKQRQ